MVHPDSTELTGLTTPTFKAQLCGLLDEMKPLIRLRRDHLGAALITLLITSLLSACMPELSELPLPEWTEAVDTAGVPQTFHAAGGPAHFHLTGWANDMVIEQFVRAGLMPLPGYAQVQRLDSIGLNVVGGRVPPGGLDRVLELPYIVKIRTCPPTSLNNVAKDSNDRATRRARSLCDL